MFKLQLKPLLFIIISFVFLSPFSNAYTQNNNTKKYSAKDKNLVSNYNSKSLRGNDVRNNPYGDSSLTTSGFSGLINLVSAEAVPNGNGLVIGGYFLADMNQNMGALVRVAIHLYDQIEFAVGLNFPMGPELPQDSNVGVKWNYWSNKSDTLKLAFLINFQLNKMTKIDKPESATQLHFMNTWFYKDVETTFLFGKTFGKYAEGNEVKPIPMRLIDLGFGIGWWFLNKPGAIFNMAWVVDYVSYNYKQTLIGLGNGNLARGNASTAFRFAFLNKKLLFDLGLMNMLNDGISFYFNFNWNLGF